MLFYAVVCNSTLIFLADFPADPDYDSFIVDSPCSHTTTTIKEEIFCPWLECQAVPSLNLPESSVDLLVESELMMSAAEVRLFSRISTELKRKCIFAASFRFTKRL